MKDGWLRHEESIILDELSRPEIAYVNGSLTERSGKPWTDLAPKVARRGVDSFSVASLKY